MPIDWRRFTGPEGSVPWRTLLAGAAAAGTGAEASELLDAEGRRRDGRAAGEARSMFVSTGMVSQAKGSAYVELKNTKVICSVFDPREIPHQTEFSQLGELFCEVKFATFSCPRQRRLHTPDAEERALSAGIKQALEPAVCRYHFPNYQVDIFVYILEHDGACLAASINAAGLALADAAVPMYDIIVSSSVAVVGDKLYLDPSEGEEYVCLSGSEGSNHGMLTVSTLPDLKQICDLTQIGSMDMNCVTNAMEVLEKECEKIVPVIQKCLVKSVKEGFREKEAYDKEALEREAELDRKLEEFKKKLRLE